MAADMAKRAAEIHSAHIRERRAPETEKPATAPTGASGLSRMASDLAKRASEIHSAHIRAKRSAGGGSSGI
jgi:hypothetical protein